MPKYEMSTVTLGELLDDPAAVMVIDRVIPGANDHPMAGLVRGLRAIDALSAAGGRLTASQREILVREIEAI